MALAKVLLKSAGLLSIDATERDCRRRHTRSEHPDAVSSSVSSTPMLQSAAVTDNDNYIGCIVDDETCDTFLGLLVRLAEGFDISPHDKAATAVEVLIDWATSSIGDESQCTGEDMDMLSKVVKIIIENKDGASKHASTTLEFMQRCERARHAVIEETNPATEQIP